MHRGHKSERSGAARIRRSIHKYKVVVGCMVCMAVVLGALLLHGAIKAVYNAKSVFTLLYPLGFCVLLAAPLLLWSSYNYIQYIEKKGNSDCYLGEPLELFDGDHHTNMTDKVEEALSYAGKEGGEENLKSQEAMEVFGQSCAPITTPICSEENEQSSQQIDTAVKGACCGGTYMEDTNVCKGEGGGNTLKVAPHCL